MRLNSEYQLGRTKQILFQIHHSFILHKIRPFKCLLGKVNNDALLAIVFQGNMNYCPKSLFRSMPQTTQRITSNCRSSAELASQSKKIMNVGLQKIQLWLKPATYLLSNHLKDLNIQFLINYHRKN